MRLPEFLTELSPIRETLEAIGRGEAALAEEVEERNRQAVVREAEDGLSLWEADYGLPGGTGRSPEDRRTDILTALAGGRTLTPAYLEELCVTLGGAERGTVTEAFQDWRVTVDASSRGKIPPGEAALRRALERLKPAHLTMEIMVSGELEGKGARYSALTAGPQAELSGDDVLRLESGKHVLDRGGGLEELHGNDAVPGTGARASALPGTRLMELSGDDIRRGGRAWRIVLHGGVMEEDACPADGGEGAGLLTGRAMKL